MFPQPQTVFLDDFVDDSGMLTPELSILMIVGVAFAGILFAIIHSAEVKEAIASLVQRALTSI